MVPCLHPNTIKAMKNKPIMILVSDPVLSKMYASFLAELGYKQIVEVREPNDYLKPFKVSQPRLVIIGNYFSADIGMLVDSIKKEKPETGILLLGMRNEKSFLPKNADSYINRSKVNSLYIQHKLSEALYSSQKK